MIVLNAKLYKPNSYQNHAKANVEELKKILSELTVKDPVVDKPKQHPSPDWIHGRPKQGATVWANERREKKPKTFKL